MNEEKIMDIIKGKLLMIKRMLEEDDNDGHASAYEMQSEDFEAIETLLTAYEKEKEKNKKIKDILQKYAHTQVGDEDKILEFYRELKETFI